MYGEKKRITYPIGLYDYLVRKANSAVGERFIFVSFPNVRIQFSELKRKGKWATIDWLYEELGKRLVRIKEKYSLDFGKEFERKEVQINYETQETSREIILSGFNRVPVKSFGNMLTIIVWSWILFRYNKKPNESEETQQMLDNYTTKLEQFKVYWNRSPRQKKYLDQPRKCHICGEEAKFFNKWHYDKKGKKEEVYTPVCEKHRNNLV